MSSQEKDGQSELILVQYCRACQTHNWCTHHDQAKYHDTFLKFAQLVGERFPKFQVIGNMLPSHLIPFKISENKFIDSLTNKYVVFPQIGTFEILFRGKLLFSKKQSHAWPYFPHILDKISQIVAGQEVITQSPPRRIIKKNYSVKSPKVWNDHLSQMAFHNSQSQQHLNKKPIYQRENLNVFTLTDHFKLYRSKKPIEDRQDSHTEKEKSQGSYRQLSEAGVGRDSGSGENKIKDMLKNKGFYLKEKGQREMIIKLDCIEEQNLQEEGAGGTFRPKEKSPRKNPMKELDKQLSTFQDKFKHFENKVQSIQARNKEFELRGSSYDEKGKIKDIVQGMKRQEFMSKQERIDRKTLEKYKKQNSMNSSSLGKEFLAFEKLSKVDQYVHSSEKQKNQQLNKIYGEWKLMKQMEKKRKKLLKLRQEGCQYRQSGIQTVQKENQSSSSSEDFYENVSTGKDQVFARRKECKKKEKRIEQGHKYSSIEQYRKNSPKLINTKTEDNFFRGRKSIKSRKEVKAKEEFEQTYHDRQKVDKSQKKQNMNEAYNNNYAKISSNISRLKNQTRNNSEEDSSLAIVSKSTVAKIRKHQPFKNKKTPEADNKNGFRKSIEQEQVSLLAEKMAAKKQYKEEFISLRQRAKDEEQQRSSLNIKGQVSHKWKQSNQKGMPKSQKRKNNTVQHNFFGEKQKYNEIKFQRTSPLTLKKQIKKKKAKQESKEFKKRPVIEYQTRQNVQRQEQSQKDENIFQRDSEQEQSKSSSEQLTFSERQGQAQYLGNVVKDEKQRHTMNSNQMFGKIRKNNTRINNTTSSQSHTHPHPQEHLFGEDSMLTCKQPNSELGLVIDGSRTKKKKLRTKKSQESNKANQNQQLENRRRKDESCSEEGEEGEQGEEVVQNRQINMLKINLDQNVEYQEDKQDDDDESGLKERSSKFSDKIGQDNQQQLSQSDLQYEDSEIKQSQRESMNRNSYQTQKQNIQFSLSPSRDQFKPEEKQNVTPIDSQQMNQIQFANIKQNNVSEIKQSRKQGVNSHNQMKIVQVKQNSLQERKTTVLQQVQQNKQVKQKRTERGNENFNEQNKQVKQNRTEKIHKQKNKKVDQNNNEQNKEDKQKRTQKVHQNRSEQNKQSKLKVNQRFNEQNQQVNQQSTEKINGYFNEQNQQVKQSRTEKVQQNFNKQNEYDQQSRSKEVNGKSNQQNKQVKQRITETINQSFNEQNKQWKQKSIEKVTEDFNEQNKQRKQKNIEKVTEIFNEQFQSKNQKPVNQNKIEKVDILNIQQKSSNQYFKGSFTQIQQARSTEKKQTIIKYERQSQVVVQNQKIEVKQEEERIKDLESEPERIQDIQNLNEQKSQKIPVNIQTTEEQKLVLNSSSIEAQQKRQQYQQKNNQYATQQISFEGQNKEEKNTIEANINEQNLQQLAGGAKEQKVFQISSSNVLQVNQQKGQNKPSNYQNNKLTTVSKGSNMKQKPQTPIQQQSQRIMNKRDKNVLQLTYIINENDDLQKRICDQYVAHLHTRFQDQPSVKESDTKRSENIFDHSQYCINIVQCLSSMQQINNSSSQLQQSPKIPLSKNQTSLIRENKLGTIPQTKVNTIIIQAQKGQIIEQKCIIQSNDNQKDEHLETKQIRNEVVQGKQKIDKKKLKYDQKDNVYSQPQARRLVSRGVQKETTLEVSVQTEGVVDKQDFVSGPFADNTFKQTNQFTRTENSENKSPSQIPLSTIRDNFFKQRKKSIFQPKNTQKKVDTRAKILQQIYGPLHQEQLLKFTQINEWKEEQKGKSLMKICRKRGITCQLIGDSLQLDKVHWNRQKLQSFRRIVRILGEKSEFLLTRLFEKAGEMEVNDNQTYGVWLCDNYKWKCVLVTDVVQVDEDGMPLRSYHEGGKLWLNLLEKAIAQTLGGYQALKAADCSQLFTMLTGCNALKFRLREQPGKNARLLRFVGQCQRKNFIIHAEKGKQRQQGEMKIYYILSQQKAGDSDTLLQLSENGKPSFWLKLSRFVQEFRSAEILQLRVGHNFTHLDLGQSGHHRLTILELRFSQESFGSISLAYLQGTGPLQAFLYRQQKSQVLKLVGQASEKNKGSLFFDCCYSQGRYFLFAQSDPRPTRVAFCGESKPCMSIAQEVDSQGLKNDYTEYLPVEVKRREKERRQAFEQWSMQPKMRQKGWQRSGFQECGLSRLRDNFVSYLLAEKENRTK